MTAGIESKFPLDFNYEVWTVEKAIPWIFFGDWHVDEPNNRTVAHKHIANLFVHGSSIHAERIISSEKRRLVEDLSIYLKRRLGPLDATSAFSPLAWCRLAIQYWLHMGRGQGLFLNAYVNWVIEKNNGGPAFVIYEESDVNSALSRKKKMLLDAFLFGEVKDSLIKSAKWRLKKLTPKTSVKVNLSTNNI